MTPEEKQSLLEGEASPETLPPRPADPEGISGSNRRASGPSTRTRRFLSRFLRRPEAGALGGVLVVYAVFAIFAHQNGFLGVAATAGWLTNASQLGIAVVPVAMLLIAGEFDLSIGSTIACTVITIGIANGHYGLSLPLSILLAFLIALTVGLFNGVAVVKTGLPSFIVTLGTSLGLAGLTLALSRLITGTTILSIQASGWTHALFAGSIGQFSVSIAWWLVLAAVSWFVLAHRVFGNWIYATGGDEEAARQAGVPTDRVKIRLFVYAALGAALVGTIQAIQYNGGTVDQGDSYVFDTIIAAVVGGVLLGGGYGSAIGAMLGAVTYGVVETGIYYTGWNSDLAQAILGGLLLVAVVANNTLRKMASREPRDEMTGSR